MSSRSGRGDPGAGGARRAREPPDQELQRRREQRRRRHDAQQLQQLKHLESFYEKPPPGLIKVPDTHFGLCHKPMPLSKFNQPCVCSLRNRGRPRCPSAITPLLYALEDEMKPEDCIPDVPGNEHAREFLAHAPTKGLWMPLGKEVKVMQCWRCKRYGHRTGDKECPFFIKGNQKLEQFRVAHEDPMYDIIRENKRHEKDMRIQQLKRLLEASTSTDSSSSSSEEEAAPRKRKRREKQRRKKEKKRKKRRKHKSPRSREGAGSDSD